MRRDATSQETGEARFKAPATKAVKKSKGRNNGPSNSRKGSTTAKILALLRRPTGASLAELRKATGWQAHSVRGYLSGAVKRKMGLRIDSIARENGERRITWLQSRIPHARPRSSRGFEEIQNRNIWAGCKGSECLFG